MKGGIYQRGHLPYAVEPEAAERQRADDLAVEGGVLVCEIDDRQSGPRCQVFEGRVARDLDVLVSQTKSGVERHANQYLSAQSLGDLGACKHVGLEPPPSRLVARGVEQHHQERATLCGQLHGQPIVGLPGGWRGGRCRPIGSVGFSVRSRGDRLGRGGGGQKGRTQPQCDRTADEAVEARHGRLPGVDPGKGR